MASPTSTVGRPPAGGHGAGDAQLRPPPVVSSRPSRACDVLFLATLFTVTFEKLHWNVAGSVGIADVFAILFVATFALGRAGRGTGRVPRTALAVTGFFVAFLLVYLIGFFNLETSEALAQFAKGMVKFVIHFAFLGAGVVYLVRRGPRFYWRALGFLTAGMVVNSLYGVLQLLVARAGGNLDASVLAPLTGGASSINIYGAVNGQSVYRPNAITGDPNHLGIMLVVPLLVLTPVYLRLVRGHPWRVPLALTLAFLLLVELATLSRSGLLGLGLGLAILALPYRRHLRTPAFLYPLAAVAVVLAGVLATRWHYFSVVLRSRVQTSGAGSSAHFDVYGFVPDIVHQHPAFGLGLNNFSIYYEFVTGKSNWGPHSFYVALIVETGIVGAALFAFFLWWVFRRLRAARALGRALAAAGDPLAARVRPLAWGMTAALAGTMAANFFYLTMQFYYFYGFLALALALPLVFRRRA